MVKVCRKNEKGGKSWVSIKYGGQVPQKETYYFNKGPLRTYIREKRPPCKRGVFGSRWMRYQNL